MALSNKQVLREARLAGLDVLKLSMSELRAALAADPNAKPKKKKVVSVFVTLPGPLVAVLGSDFFSIGSHGNRKENMYRAVFSALMAAAAEVEDPETAMEAVAEHFEECEVIAGVPMVVGELTRKERE